VRVLRLGLGLLLLVLLVLLVLIAGGGRCCGELPVENGGQNFGDVHRRDGCCLDP
jgi:hypothetical protein